MTNQMIDDLVNVFSQILPEIILGLAACICFLGGTVRSSRNLWGFAGVCAIGTACLALAWSHQTFGMAHDVHYASPVIEDDLAMIIRIIALIGGFVLILVGWNEVPHRQAADYQGCLLLIVAGLCLTAGANELVILFLALELISIPTYVLLYLPRHDSAAQEAALKYFLLSIFSSALLLFGFSYLYGLAGTTNLPGLLDALNRAGPGNLPGIIVPALVLIVAGLGFKITAVPFHFYAPDVYQGAPTSVVAVLAFIPKVAGFVALLRVLGFAWPIELGNGLAMGDQVPILFWILAAVTMSLGNVLALLQDNIKRLLAYSSVAHAGYLLMGLAIAQPLAITASGARLTGGVEAVLFYLVAYGAMTTGAFAVLSYLNSSERPVEMEDDLGGLSQSHPGLALMMALFLFSLIGIPLTAGFVGKLVIFFGSMTVEGDNARLFRWLALLGVLNAAVGAWYYMRILAKMYLHTPIKPLATPRSLPGLAAIWICAILTVGLGIFPSLIFREGGLLGSGQVAQENSASRSATDNGHCINFTKQ